MFKTPEEILIEMALSGDAESEYKVGFDLWLKGASTELKQTGLDLMRLAANKGHQGATFMLKTITKVSNDNNVKNTR